MLLPRRLPAAVGLEPSNNATETADHPPSKLARPKNNNNDEDEQEDKNEEAVVESTATTTAAATSGTPCMTTTPTVEQGAPLHRRLTASAMFWLPRPTCRRCC